MRNEKGAGNIEYSMLNVEVEEKANGSQPQASSHKQNAKYIMKTVLACSLKRAACSLY
jgi:hypothetical protein